MESVHDEPLFTNHDTWFNFVKTFLDKENYFWEQVLSSVETKMGHFGHYELLKIWCKKGEVFLPKNRPNIKTWKGLDDVLGLF